MSILASIILGIIQGLTEFLPISSSGHIAIVNHFLNSGFEAENYGLMTIVLHAATAISTIYVFRKDIKGIIRGVYSKDNNSTDFSIKILLSDSMISGLQYTFSILNFDKQVFKSINPIKSTNLLNKSLYSV